MSELDVLDLGDLGAMLESLADDFASRYKADHLHKFFYFADKSAEEEFWNKPTVRFTPKIDLNDPFEFSQRWDTITSDSFRQMFDAALLRHIRDKIADPERLVLKSLEKLNAESGTHFTLADIEARVPGGIKSFMNLQTKKIEQSIPLIMSRFWAQGEAEMPRRLEQISDEMGILSLTGNLHSGTMWAHYAGSGEGFALTFNVQNAFFLNEQNNRLQRVTYTNDRQAALLDNPYYLYLVKNEDFAYEEEWRMSEKLDNCNMRDLPNGRVLYTRPMTPGILHAITFGYATSVERIASALELLRGFDPEILAFRMEVNRRLNRLERVAL